LAERDLSLHLVFECAEFTAARAQEFLVRAVELRWFAGEMGW
jgi:hypothetical protein